jgi:hypothetical protein
MTPVLAHIFRKPGSFLPRKKRTPIGLAEGLTCCAQLPRVRPDAQRGGVKKHPGAPGKSPRSRATSTVLRGVLAGSAEPRRLGPGDVPRHAAEPPASAGVFSGSATACPGAAELFFGSAARSAGRAADFFYAAVTLETSRKRLGMCILQPKTKGRVFVSPTTQKRPLNTLNQHG